MKDETLRSAFQNWEELSQTQEEFLAYESRLKRILDEEAAQREAELRLQEIERREEEAKRIEQEAKRREEKAKEMQKRVARRLLSMEIPLEEIVKTTELSKDEVIEVEKEMKNS